MRLDHPVRVRRGRAQQFVVDVLLIHTEFPQPTGHFRDHRLANVYLTRIFPNPYLRCYTTCGLTHAGISDPR